VESVKMASVTVVVLSRVALFAIGGSAAIDVVARGGPRRQSSFSAICPAPPVAIRFVGAAAGVAETSELFGLCPPEFRAEIV